VATPLAGAAASGYEPDCPVRVDVLGTAVVGEPAFDIYFVLDSSGSTGRCSGQDIDGDGVVGVDSPFGSSCSDPEDSVLGAQIEAVGQFVDTLSPTTSRVAVIQFSNPEDAIGLAGRQRIVQPLTSDFPLVHLALADIALAGSSGATDYGGGLALLEEEFLSSGDPIGREQFAYFLSDGVPTFPVSPFNVEDPGDSQWALDVADRLAGEGIRVDTFGVGFLPSTTLDPVLPSRCQVIRPGGAIDLASTLECVALRTGGLFVASSDPAAIVDELRLRQPAGIDSVTVTNETTGDVVEAVLAPDGGFSASVPVELGVVNLLRIVAVAEDGTSCEVFTDFLPLCFAAGSDGCSPLTQGYWHRQCLGQQLIPTRGRMGDHPDWEGATLRRIMEAIVDPQVAALGSPEDTTTCQGLDAVPQNDPCQKAIKQYTAVLMNMAGGHLGPSCLLDLPGLGLVTPEEAAAAIAALIRDGLAGDERACERANDLADRINTGAALR
jgi:hypothetical protein